MKAVVDTERIHTAYNHTHKKKSQINIYIQRNCESLIALKCKWLFNMHFEFFVEHKKNYFDKVASMKSQECGNYSTNLSLDDFKILAGNFG